MEKQVQDLILKATNAKMVVELEVIQRLWSNYGVIARYRLTGSDRNSVIVKQVKLSGTRSHPCGWNTDQSHQRKIRSYQVEMAWYSQWSERCAADCRVPFCIATARFNEDLVIVLEDLDSAGFSHRRSRPGKEAMQACLHWLANFHATFMSEYPKDLWPTGTYWHLETRPDEWNELKDAALKNAASAIDIKLRNSRYQSFVHGDAKLDNFCFSPDGKKVAAVDFQYVGGGCGIKDVVYFIDSCLGADECQRQESLLLDMYFQALRAALRNKQKSIAVDAVEQEWRALYPVAWADFHRFFKGWNQGHWPGNAYGERLARQVIAELSGDRNNVDAPNRK